ncbi:serine hydrolase [Rhizobium sp. 60-20]|uniref:serine hydrolase domain-containing protein n=1 Tax=Rhizobium sp. 60-20 TaxID=1895819 RepID=UPI00092A00AA|nr:serine hydrolase [Rhizobium sp. 60-20]OJY74427.1 MAG: hypothetical protein BGP09_18315 [Rhizobium sp. 60-20]
MSKHIQRPLILNLASSLCTLMILVGIGPAYAQATDNSPWPTKEWLTSTPEEQGMDSSALAKLVAYGADHNFDSLLVVRHGRIVTEAYYAPYTADIPHEIFSSTKAVTGTLLGMVYTDGVLDRLDHPVLDFFPDRRVANMDDRKKALTVKDLLNMTSGFDWDQGYEGGPQQTMRDMDRSSNWVQFVLDRPMAHPPGEVYNYSNGDADLVSAIITRLTGKPAEDYARQRLFAPLGIADWYWNRDPQGLTIGYGMLFLLPRDMAKIGYLYLHHGEWEGKQLLPTGWADILNHPLVNMHASYDPNQSYSNFFWVFPDKHAYMATGKDGQLIAVFPDLDIVAVTTATKYVKYRALIDGVSSAVKSQAPLPPNPNAAAQLANAISDATVEKSAPVGPVSEIATTISGKTYRFSENQLGLKSLTLFLADARPHVEYELYLDYPTGSSFTSDMPIGLDGFYRKGLPALSGPYPGHIPAVRGTWSNVQTFVIDTRDIGSGTQIKYRLSFDGRKLNIRRIDEEGWELSANGERDP